MKTQVTRGQLIFVNLPQYPVGAEQGGKRPALVIQNNIGNTYSPTTIIAPITSEPKKPQPTHIFLKKSFLQFNRHPRNSTILCEQVRTISKSRILAYGPVLPDGIMQKVNHALEISMGIN